MFATQARKDGKERAAPEYWQEQAQAWLQGYDGVAMGAIGAKPVNDQMEAEVDEEAVGGPGD